MFQDSVINIVIVSCVFRISVTLFCPPFGSSRLKGALSDCEELEEESDNDSDVTWPPRSARVVKEPIPSPRVRLYDHNTRLSKECSSRPLYKVTPVNPIAQQVRILINSLLRN